MSALANIEYQYITSTPGVLGGEPHIVGKRVAVSLIVELALRQGATMEEITGGYPVTPAEVHAALSYYYDHQAEIDKVLQAWYDAARRHKKSPFQAAMLKKAGQRGLNLESDDADREMTTSEVAEEFHVSPRVVRITATRGWIPARKSGATWLIRRRDALARWGSRIAR